MDATAELDPHAIEERPEPKAEELPLRSAPDPLVPDLRQKPHPALWAVLTLAIFMVATGVRLSLRSMGLLVGVLLFHELGHFLGMKIFGYRDVKVFFVPYVGALMSGDRGRAREWQQAVVLLLGPLPGLLLGFGLALWNLVTPSVFLDELVPWLIGLNAFNLLPLAPLDGGALLELVLFSRRRVLQALFLAASALGLIALGLALKVYFLVGFGIVGLLLVPFRLRLATAASALRQRWPAMPDDLDEANDDLRDELLTAARRLQRGSAPQPARTAAIARELHQAARVRPLGRLATALLLLCYVGGLGLAAGALVLHSVFGQSMGQTVRAGFHAGQGRHDLAIKDMNEAIRLYPENAVLYTFRADLWSQMGDDRKTLADYSEAIRLAEEQARPGLEDGLAYNAAAWLLVAGPTELRAPDRALPWAQKAVALSQRKATVLNTLGVVYYRLGRHAEARAMLQEALRADSSTPSALDWFFLAMAQKALGSEWEARRSYDKAVVWLEGQNALPPGQRRELDAIRAEAEQALGVAVVAR